MSLIFPVGTLNELKVTDLNLFQKLNQPNLEIKSKNFKAKILEDFNKDFTWVVFPSLFTKLYGRSLMLSGVIQYHNFANFILLNLSYAAPFISLLGGLITFSIAAYRAKSEQKSCKEVLLTGLKMGMKTATKFFIVYMSWTLSIGMVMSLGLLTGPYLIVGLLITGVATSMGLFLATVLTEILPNLPDKNLALASRTLSRAFTEGLVWTLIEHFSISVALGGSILGKVLDTAAVSLVVSFSFIAGGVVEECAKNLLKYFKTEVVKHRNKAVDRVNNLLVLCYKHYSNCQNYPAKFMARGLRPRLAAC